MENFKPTTDNNGVNKIEREAAVEVNEKIEKDENISINSIDENKSEKELRESKEKNEIKNLKEEINKSLEKRKGYSFSFKPESVWNPKEENYNFDPISKITNYFKRFSKEEIEKRKIQKNNEKSLREDVKKYGAQSFDYKPGDGVIGMTGKSVGMLANGFRNCSALVFKKGDSVSVLHISPESLNHFSDYSLKDTDLYGHIRFALKEILESEKEKYLKKTNGGLILGENEINKLQKLFDSGEIKATMIHGEDKMSLELPLGFATRANALKLPFFKTDSYYIGGQKLGTGFSVYANPENIYVIGENNRVIKKDIDFPPTMIDFK